jgi:hypothetical protein
MAAGVVALAAKPQTASHRPLILPGFPLGWRRGTLPDEASLR